MPTVDDYIDQQPVQTQARLRELRTAIRAAVPEATELISYDMPAYALGGRSVYFAAAKRHCALYGVPLELVPDGFPTSKGTVRFPLDKPIPEDLVKRLVTAKLRGD